MHLGRSFGAQVSARRARCVLRRPASSEEEGHSSLPLVSYLKASTPSSSPTSRCHARYDSHWHTFTHPSSAVVAPVRALTHDHCCLLPAMASEDEIRAFFIELDTDGDGWINQTTDLQSVRRAGHAGDRERPRAHQGYLRVRGEQPSIPPRRFPLRPTPPPPCTHARHLAPPPFAARLPRGLQRASSARKREQLHGQPSLHQLSGVLQPPGQD